MKMYIFVLIVMLFIFGVVLVELVICMMIVDILKYDGICVVICDVVVGIYSCDIVVIWVSDGVMVICEYDCVCIEIGVMVSGSVIGFVGNICSFDYEWICIDNGYVVNGMVIG